MAFSIAYFYAYHCHVDYGGITYVSSRKQIIITQTQLKAGLLHGIRNVNTTVVKSHGLYNVYQKGYWTTRGYASSQTGHIADWST